MCEASGGLSGAITAAFLTQDKDPQVCFLIYSFLGILLLFGALNLNKEVELIGQNRSEINQNGGTLREKLAYSGDKIWEALQVKEIYSIILFMVFYAILVPNFGAFDYYFMLDVVGITQFQYSMISVLHFVCVFIGSWVFRKFFREYEVRTLIIIEIIIGLCLSPFTMLFVTRKNLEYGISDGFIIIFTDIIGDIFSMCLVVLPMSIMFTKITPK